MRRFGIFGVKSKPCYQRRTANDSMMSILELNDHLLQNILKFLDNATFANVSSTCKRLNEIASSYLSWNWSLMEKRVERLIYRTLDCKNQKVAKAIYDSCCNAEMLNLNLEIIDETRAACIWKEIGDLGARLFSLIVNINICDTNEIWPFCQVIDKEMKFGLGNGNTVTVCYISLCDKQNSFNNHTRIRIKFKSPGSKDRDIVFNSKPMGLLDSGIVQNRMAEPVYGETVDFDKIQNTDVLRPALEVFEQELGVSEHAISFEYFVKFLKSIDKISNCGCVQADTTNSTENSAIFKEVALKTKRNRNKLQVEFLRLERERNDSLNTEADYEQFSYCLAKMAQRNGKQIKNIRLRAQCIRDILSDTRYGTMQQDMRLLPGVISNIDLDSIKTGWACINPNLFTIWKEFSIKIGHGRQFKATITWQEKRERLNEYSVSDKEICLVLQRKRFTRKLKMSSESSSSEFDDRWGSIRQMKTELKKLISRVRLRKTGLNGINQHYLFIILMTILNE